MRRVVLWGIMLICAVASVLDAQQIPELDTVRVRVASLAARSLVVVSRGVQVISKEEIAQSGARTIQEALQRALSVDVLHRSASSANVTIRGTSLGQVLMLVDGVRMTDRQTPHFDLDLAVPLAHVERLEILRGGASAQYGADAVGGVINVVTSQSLTDDELITEEVPTAAELHAGSFGIFGAAFRVPLVSLAADRCSGHRAGTDYRNAQGRVSLGGAELGASFGQAVRDFGANSFYGPYDSHERTATTTAEVHLEHELRRGRGGRREVLWTASPGEAAITAAVSLATRRHADQFTLQRRDPSFYRNRHVGLQSSVMTTVRYGSAFAIGVQLDDARLISARLGDRHDLTGAGFLQAALGGGEHDRAAMDFGLRSDWSNGFGTFLSPSVAASIVITDRVRARGAASRAFRAPSWTERYYTDPANVGTADLRAEKFGLVELGLHAFPTWGGLLDAAYWMRGGRDVIDWSKPTNADATEPWRTRNFAEIEFHGGEAELQSPALLGAALQFAANASLVKFDARSAEGFVGKYALRPLTSTLGARASVRVRDGVSVAFDGRRFRRAGDSRGYLDAGVDVQVALPVARLSAHVENLANVSYLDVAGRPVAGRNTTVFLSFP